MLQAASVAAKPHITEFNAPPTDIIGPVQFITAGSDHALWFTGAESNVVGRITTRGSVSTRQVGSQTSFQEITSGPDGNLWFT